MNKSKMKYAGITVMILSHPAGYFFWRWLLINVLHYEGAYSEVLYAVLVGVGILGFFFVGLALFIIGVILDYMRANGK